MRKQHLSDFFFFSCDVVTVTSKLVKIARVREREQRKRRIA